MKNSSFISSPHYRAIYGIEILTVVMIFFADKSKTGAHIIAPEYKLC